MLSALRTAAHFNVDHCTKLLAGPPSFLGLDRQGLRRFGATIFVMAFLDEAKVVEKPEGVLSNEASGPMLP